MRRPEAFIQWKGTDVCVDVTCTCGFFGHYDGYFAYNVECPQCGRVWAMPTEFLLTEGEQPAVKLKGDDDSS